MEENNQKPRLRFKGFTEAWEQRKLGEIFEYERPDKYIVESEEYSENSNTPVLTANKAFILGYTDEDNVYKKEKESVIFDDFTLDSKFVDFPYMVKSSAIKILTLKNKNRDNLRFSFELLNSTKFDMLGHARHYISVVQPREVLTPNKQEQDKISQVFESLDNLITLHQRKCDKLVNVKKALLEKMFPNNGKNVPELRFSGFTEAWEQRKLSDFGKSTGGTSIESEFEDSGKYKVISIGSYSENSKYNDQGLRCKLSDKTKIRILNQGDLTMILNDKTAQGRIIGRALLIDKSDEYVYNQRTERIETDTEKYDSHFIYQLLNAPNMREKIIKQSQGNTQIFVNWTAIQNTEYLVPSKKEQKQIGEYFDQLDNLITLHQQE